MESDKNIASLKEVSDLENVGHKALQIQILSENEFNVPQGFVLTTNFFNQFIKENLIDYQLRTSILDCIEKGKFVENIRDVLEEKMEVIRSSILEGELPDGFAERMSQEMETYKAVSIRCSGLYGENKGLTSFVNVVESTDAIECVRMCWASLFCRKSVSQLLDNGLFDCFFGEKKVKLPTVAVVIQQMVSPKFCGECFTIDVGTGNRNCATVLVRSGLTPSQPCEYVLSKKTMKMEREKITAKEEVITKKTEEEGSLLTEITMKTSEKITKEQLEEIVFLAKKIEGIYSGFPQEIDWCIDRSGKIHIIQTKKIENVAPPLSPIDYPFPGYSGIFDKSNYEKWGLDFMKRFDDSGKRVLLDVGFLGNYNLNQPFTPLGMSIVKEHAEQVLSLLRTNKENIRILTSGGRLYLSCGDLLKEKKIAKLKDLLEYIFEERKLYTGKFQSQKNFLKISNLVLSMYKKAGMNVLMPKGFSIEKMEKNYSGKVEKLRKKANKTSDVRKKKNFDIEYKIQKKLIAMRECVFIPNPIYSTCLSLLVKNIHSSVVERLSGAQKVSHVLNRGLVKNVKIEMIQSIMKMGEFVSKNKELRRRLKTLPRKIDSDKGRKELQKGKETVTEEDLRSLELFIQMYDKFFSKYGFRGDNEMEISSLRYNEDITPVVKSILLNSSFIDDNTSLNEKKKNSSKEHKKNVTSLLKSIKRKTSRNCLNFMSFCTYSPIMTKLMKNSLEISKKALSTKEIEEYHYFKVMNDIREFGIEIGKLLKELNIVDKEECVFFLTINEIGNILKKGISKKVVKDLVEYRKNEFENFKEMKLPMVMTGEGEDILRTISIEKEQNIKVLYGEGVCPAGVCVGTANVIDSEEDISSQILEVLPGEIIVAKETHPIFAEAFTKCGAVVVETQTKLRYSAITAWELGIPCVVIQEATVCIKNGDLIEVNGGEGTVKILQKTKEERVKKVKEDLIFDDDDEKMGEFSFEEEIVIEDV